MLTHIPQVFLSALWALTPAEKPAETPAAAPPSEAEIMAFEDLAEPLQEEKKEKSPFSGSVNAGASASFGNTRITKVNVNAAATYVMDEKNRVSGLFDWLWSQEKSVTTKISTVTQRRTRGALQYDHLFTEKVYGFVRADATNDGIQDLDLRLILSAGLGYQVIDTDEEKLAAGLAYTHEDFKGASPDDYMALRLAAKYFKQITEDLKFNGTVEWLPSLEDSDDQIVLGTAQLDYNLGKGFLTSLRYEFDYDNTPKPGNDRIDHRVIWGLGFTF